MKNLFIIGNGFDLAHNLKTSYEDFHRYLKNKYPQANEEKFVQPEVITMPDGGEECEDVDTVSFLMRIISITEFSGDEWSDIETSLGRLDYSEYFDWLDYEFDEDGDIDIWKQSHCNEDIASNLILPSLKISDYFSDWINTIEINNKVLRKKDFINLMDKNNNLFLSFNYTKTLEALYQVKNVCHIHGKQGEKLLFGHGNDEDCYEDSMNKYIGSENAFQQIQNCLRKDTISAIKQHQSFFSSSSLSSVKNIYSYGFSFSEVDKIYIKEICNKITNYNITWYLNQYDSDEKRECYKNMITSCGFKGKFDTYHIGC